MRRKLLVLIALLVSSTMAWAADHTDSQGVEYTIIDDQHAYISGYSGSASAIVINNGVTINSMARIVTDIADGVFQNHTELTSVRFQDVAHITSIGKNVFNGCTGLTSITFPDCVTSIEEGAFSGCTGLTSLIISGHVTSIGANAFYGCSGLTTITIGSYVTSIGQDAFKGCTNCGIVFCYANPSSLTWDENGCDDFKAGKNTRCYVYNKDNWSGFTATVNLDFWSGLSCGNGLTWDLTAGVLTISKTGDGDGKMTDYTLYSDLLPWSDFRSSVTTLVIEDGVKSIGNWTFHNENNLTSITIPNGVTSIGEYAFFQSRAFSSIDIPNSVTSIKRFAFQGCEALTTINMGTGLTSVENDAFTNCPNLTTVNITDLAAWCKISFNNAGANPLHITHSLYLNDAKITNLEIPDGTTSIGSYTFYSCTDLTSVSIPNTVKSIGNGAFQDCTNLGSATVPSSITNIGNSAFSGCSNLAQFDIPSNVTNIGEDAFKDCVRFTTFTIPSGVTAIKKGAFYGCTGLGSVTIPSSVTSIGAWAFNGCRSLGSVTIPNSVTSIGNGAFNACTALGSINFPASVKQIEENAFNGCSNLSSVTFAEGIQLEYIGMQAFENCTGIGSLTIPATIIDYRAFDGCSNLRTVSFTSSVRRIRDDTFWGCSKLETINFEEGLEHIGLGAFRGCAIEWVSFPSTIRSISTASFRDCPNLRHIFVWAPSLAEYKEAFSGCSDFTIIVPVGCGNTYKAGWSFYSDRIIDNNFGLCDNGIGWQAPSYRDDGIFNVLRIVKNTEGSGAIQDYAQGKAPWHPNAGSFSIVYLEGDVTRIGTNTFNDFSTLISVVIETSTPPTYDGDIFRDCDALAAIFVPKAALSAYQTAWPDYRSKLIGYDGYCGEAEEGEGKRIVWALNDGILSIAGCPLMNNYSAGGAPWYSRRDEIKTVFIGEGVWRVGENAFYGCTNLTRVFMEALSLYEYGAGAFDNCNDNLIIYVPSGSSSTYKEGWPAYKDKISEYPAGYCGDPTVNNGYDVLWNLTDGVLTISGTGAMKNFDPKKAPWYSDRESITSIVIGADVTSIGNHAFDGCNNASLTTVNIPAKVTSIGTYAFNGCSHLTAINIPAAVTGIGDYAFSGCSNLTTITIPVGVINIGNNAFDGCSNLISAVIPVDYEYLGRGSNAFKDCDALTAIYVPQSRLDAFKGAWSEHAAKIKAFDGFCGDPNVNAGKYVVWELHDGILSIDGAGAMANYTAGTAPWYTSRASITSVVIGEGVTSVGNYAFDGCSSLTSAFLGATSLTSYGAEAFKDCNASLKIFVPMGCRATYMLGWTAYSNKIFEYPGGYCGNPAVDGGQNVWWMLTDHVLYIGGTGAMADYTEGTAPWYADRETISSVVIGEGVTSVGAYAFDGCANLTSAVIEATTLTSYGSNAFNGCSDLVAIYVPKASLNNYQAGWSDYTSKLVGFDGYCGYPDVNAGKYVVWALNDNVLTIVGAGAMNDYTAETAPWNASKTSITSAVVGEFVTSVGNNAFNGCSNLTTAYLGASSLIYYGEGAFTGCNASLKIYVPIFSGSTYKENWTTYQDKIYEYAIDYCGDPSVNNGKDVAWTMIDGVLTFIGTGAMNNFTTGTAPWYAYRETINTITIEEGVTSIGDYAFEGCNNASLTSVTIPYSVTSIGANAFHGCTHLASALIKAETLTSYGSNAFSGCDALTAIHVLKASLDTYKTNWSDYESKFVGFDGFCGDPDVNSGHNLMWTLEDAEDDLKILTITGNGAMKNYDRYNWENRVPWYADRETISSVVIGDGVTSVGVDAFYSHVKLSSAYFETTSLTTYGTGAFDYCNDALKIYVPIGCSSTYQAGWERYYGRIHEYTFGYCGDPSVNDGKNVSWTLLGSILTISGTGMMNNFTAGTAPWYAYRETINTITIEEGVTSIGDYAFDGCNNANLTYVTIPSSVSIFGSYAFNGCSHLTDFDIPASVTSIGANAFNGCATLATVTYRATSLTSYGSDAFSECSALTTIYVPAAAIDAYRTNWPVYANKFVAYLINEGFEGGTLPTGWSQTSRYWEITTGTSPYDPDTAATGTYNACCTGYGDSDELITPVMNLNGARSAKLTFKFKNERFFDRSNSFKVDYYHIDSWENLYTTTDEVTSYTLVEIPLPISGYNFKIRFNCQADYTNTLVDDIILTVVQDQTMPSNKVDDAYWCTYYNSSYAVTVDGNTEIYYISTVENGNATLTKNTTDKVISAGQAVVLKSTAEDVTMSYSEANSAHDYSGNLLRGVNEATLIGGSAYAGKVIYTLARENSRLGFYKYYDNVSDTKFTTNTTLAARKAFLPLDAEVAAGARGFVFDFDEITGVNVGMQREKPATAVYYDLQGRRVAQPKKGLYIKNGKKVVIK